MKPRSSSTHRLAPFADSSIRVHCQRTAWDAAFAFRMLDIAVFLAANRSVLE